MEKHKVVLFMHPKLVAQISRPRAGLAIICIVLRYAWLIYTSPTATRVSSFFPFFGDVAFSEYFCTSTVFLVACFPLPDGVFLPCDHGLDF